LPTKVGSKGNIEPKAPGNQWIRQLSSICPQPLFLSDRFHQTLGEEFEVGHEFGKLVVIYIFILLPQPVHSDASYVDCITDYVDPIFFAHRFWLPPPSFATPARNDAKPMAPASPRMAS
jgi:hypothetical protein